MRTPEEIIKGLKACKIQNMCVRCPYRNGGEVPGERSTNCLNVLHEDAVGLILSLLDNNAPAPETSQEPVQAPEPWTREKVLAEAKKNVCGQREQDYGSPEDSFGMIAELWTAYAGYTFNSYDVAVMMALLKVARLSNSPNHMDSWVDLAGYAACGGEIAGKEAEP